MQVRGGQHIVCHQRVHVGKHVGVDPLQGIAVHVPLVRQRFHTVGLIDIALVDLDDVGDVAPDGKAFRHTLHVVDGRSAAPGLLQL